MNSDNARGIFYAFFSSADVYDVQFSIGISSLSCSKMLLCATEWDIIA